MGNTWYILEQLSPAVDLTFDCQGVLSLTPEASFQLREKKTPFFILEDYYREEDLMAESDAYFDRQLLWFQRLDELLKEHVSSCREEGLCLGSAHYYRLKFFMDSVVIFSRVFLAFLDSVKPQRIHYIAKANIQGSNHFALYGDFAAQAAFLPALLKQLCAQRRIAFSFSGSTVEEKQAAGGAAASWLKQLLKAAHYFFKYSKMSKLFHGPSGCKTALVSLHAGCVAIDSLIREAIRSNSTVFLKQGGLVKRIDAFFHKTELDLTTPASGPVASLSQELERAYEAVMSDAEMTAWLSRESNADLQEVVRPYLKDFIEQECLKNLSEVPWLREFYRTKKIEYVVARASAEQETVSSFLAAEGRAKRVCFQHACGAFESKFEDRVEANLIDIYFAMHKTAREDLIHSFGMPPGEKCAVYEDDSHLRLVQKRWRCSRASKNRVMYIPTKLFLGYRSFNLYLYPLTWYFEFQRALVDFFSKKNDLTFIFKYAPGQAWSFNSIIPYIKKERFRNILIETRPVSECLGGASRVLLDYPSTSLYEASVSSASVMSLYPELLPIRESARRLFGKSLQPFRTIPEALQKVEVFLNAEQNDYRVDVPLSAAGTRETYRKWLCSRTQREEKHEYR